MALGAPALLIPFPFAAEKHQDKNAKFLCDRDAAVMLFDNELSGARFTETVESLLGDKPRLRRMAGNCRKLHRPGAAAAMAEHLLKYCTE
jgi:UDP-N-acetylglucosamine--N-acetylmuramyl-(pentapeptide) pyrophosphoryl-undecaprenol N-acetylglucosamine transferase